MKNKVKRKLGRSFLFVPSLILGAMDRRDSADEERITLFKSAIELGFSTIDTAPLYGFGQAEKQLGALLRQVSHDHVQILTKVGLRWDGDAHGDVLFSFTDAHGSRQQVRKNSRPESLRWEVEQSLKRLGLTSIDLVQVHHPDRHVPIEETMGTLLDLRHEGKLRYIGVSNYSAEQIKAAQQALGDVPLCSVQPEYSLVRRGAESQILPLCQDLDIGVMVYSPLGAGVLAGSQKTMSDPGTEKIRQIILEALQPIAEEHNASNAAVALAWVISQPGITAAICGASTIQQLEQQAQAFNIELSESELEQLGVAFADAQLPDPKNLKSRGLYGIARRVRRFMGRTARRMGVDTEKLKRTN